MFFLRKARRPLRSQRKPFLVDARWATLADDQKSIAEMIVPNIEKKVNKSDASDFRGHTASLAQFLYN